MTPRDPFDAIRAALELPLTDESPAAVARLEPRRRRRAGVPEIVYGEGKDDATVAAICRELLAEEPRVIVSRLGDARLATLAQAVPEATLERHFPGQTAVLARADLDAATRGFVAIITAGTSDLPAAGEAATVAREMGCRVELVADVGVAGLHRLVAPLRRVVAEGADVIVVAAGMDGALPSVVTGLVAVPVIGLPTAVGYGVAAGGHAALNTMLATCAPGMTVVNIDNGVGAGATAALIARGARRGDG